MRPGQMETLRRRLERVLVPAGQVDRAAGSVVVLEVVDLAAEDLADAAAVVLAPAAEAADVPVKRPARRSGTVDVKISRFTGRLRSLSLTRL